MNLNFFIMILVSDSTGKIFELPGYQPLAQSGTQIREPEPDELTPMPEGAHFYFLPDRFPLALKRKKIIPIEEGVPAAVILPQGYTRTLLPAYGPENAETWLPYFGYTAVFSKTQKVYVAAVPTQADAKWNPESFPGKTLKKLINQRLSADPKNRTLQQLGLCASQYHCYTAANIFFERWEGALPVSPSCNAFCRGCISKTIDEGPPSPQERFNFIPTEEECLKIIQTHFSKAEEPIISFGQGCEGEPSLQGKLIEQLILKTRRDFPKGQFNINTNGSRPKMMEKLFKAGMDSIRISLNSVQEKWYNAYYRPTHYTFSDVIQTLQLAKQYGIFVSLNLLCFPGVTDSERETEKFFNFLLKSKPDLIQLRNLNIDPWCYLKECIKEETTGMGMTRWIHLIKKEFPKIKIGNFTPYLTPKNGDH